MVLSDGGADHRAARHPITAERIPRYAANLAKHVPTDGTVEFDVQLLNGQPGLVLRLDGRAYQAVVIAAAHGQVQRLLTIRNPDKLRSLDAEPIA